MEIIITGLLIVGIFALGIQCDQLSNDIDKLWSSRDSAYKQIQREVQERVRLNKKLRSRVAKLERTVVALIKKSGDSTPRYKL